MNIICALLAVAAISLNGSWDFRFEEGKSIEQTADPAFEATDAMSVPGCFDTMPKWFLKRGTGLYRRTFTLERSVDNAWLVVDGMGLRGDFRIDGKPLGVQPFPYAQLEIPTGPLAAGEHTLFAALDNRFDWTTTKLARPFYDFYFYGGFYHGVKLVFDNRRLLVRTRDYAKGEIEVEIVGDDAEVEKVGGGGQRTLVFDGTNEVKAAFRNGRATVTVPNFKLWSPEHPNLHAVALKQSNNLNNPNNRTILSARFGIRTIEAKGRGLYLNGEKIFLKGVNRHETHIEFGAATTETQMVRDLQILKSLGANFIRGAHYPQAQRFLDLCDEFGILVWEESLGWANGQDYVMEKDENGVPRIDDLADAEFRRLQKEQTRTMVRASFNHPSVVIFGFLNECGSMKPACKTLVDDLIATIRAEDSGRLVTFACNMWKDDICHSNTDIVSVNAYPGTIPANPGTPKQLHEQVTDGPNGFNTILKTMRERYPDKPIVISESGVGAEYGARDPAVSFYSEDFQELYLREIMTTLWENPDASGFAIWQFTDTRTYKPEPDYTRGRHFGCSYAGIVNHQRLQKKSCETVQKFFTEKVPAALRGERKTIAFLPDELWWGGTVGDGARMPLDATSVFVKDLRVDSSGNQAAPLLLSSKGRWVWCEDAFRFAVSNGVLTVETCGVAARTFAPIRTGMAPGGTLRAAYEHCSKTFFPPKGHPRLEFFRQPILNTWVELNYNQNEEDVLKYAQSFLDNGMKPGVLMIDCFWQTDAFGPWTFHAARFRNPKGMSEKLHAMGYNLMLWMGPFVTMDTMPYRYLRDNGGILKRAPGSGESRYQSQEFNSALAQEGYPVRWWDGVSAVWDPTSPVGRKWMRETLARVMRDYGVDGFFFDGAGPHEFTPGAYLAYDRTAQPTDLTRAFQSMALEVPFQQVREAWKLGGEPLMCTLRDKGPYWSEMKRCVTDMIAAGQLGYPFVVADLVGGGTCGNNGSGIIGVNWQEELFIRHLQIQCLSPMIQFSGSPWRILSPKGQEIVRRMLKLRERFAPKIEALAVECGKTGLPMLRSLEFQYPNRGYARIRDQFLMGDDLLVAPVVEGGAKTRTVVIPDGTWKADDGTVVTGPTTATVDTPLDRLVYFVRQ